MSNALNQAALPAPKLPLKTIDVRKGIVARGLTPLLSAAILIAALWQLRYLDVRGVIAMVPRSPLFWLLFAAGYLALPASEWMIYRRLWTLPPRGFLALLRKRISNEIIAGYSGELYFYAWARRHASLVGTPFGAIKDVSILSAVVANVCTLVLAAVSWQSLVALNLGTDAKVMIVSAASIALPSVVALVMRKRLFTLPRDELGRIAVIHLLRIVATTVFAAALWAVALPAAPLAWWLVLATLRLLVSRLPLLPNKDIVFAGLVAFTVGQASNVAAMLTMIAALWLVTHLLLGAALTAVELLNPEHNQ
ncbi:MULTISPECIES: hypothetical protein [unclassified Sphingomonas]|uniref:hypothetical protein n=1 Tax=unclassified Sphingomonas TaxID=196159 RepID=UPI000FF49609|nr:MULTISPECIES: hypothetical protein [unclassified Sphingomonas]RKE50556.1 hypothetical protein C8J39_2127 [Sphingomonas sp. PP-CC-1A-547]TCM08851.1 hypothetical protein C8J41_102830 [Sphingomonas sp. PP-CC-3G-468]